MKVGFKELTENQTCVFGLMHLQLSFKNNLSLQIGSLGTETISSEHDDFSPIDLIIIFIQVSCAFTKNQIHGTLLHV